jgi:hypothetical protein
MSTPTTTPVPSGWYAVASSADVRAGTSRPLRRFSADLGLFRTRSGTAGIVCTGGPRAAEDLECARRTWAVTERDGAIFAWYDARDGAPRAELPRLDMRQWTPFRFERVVVVPQPKETIQDLVLRTHCEVADAFFVSGTAVRLPVSVDVATQGIGYTLVEGDVPAFHVRLRCLILATPVDGRAIELRVGVAISPVRSPLVTAVLTRALRWKIGGQRRIPAPPAAGAPVAQPVPA